MPRFNVTVEFDLGTSVEPDIYAWEQPSGTDEFEDSSYFRSEEFSVSGGSLSFVIEADDDEAAEELVRSEVIYDQQEVEDRNGLTWVVENLSVEVERVLIPMTLDRAKEILTGLIASGDDEEVREAVEYVFDTLTSLEARLNEATSRIAGLVTRVEAAEARENA
jgi:hypothetical protein